MVVHPGAKTRRQLPSQQLRLVEATLPLARHVDRHEHDDIRRCRPYTLPNEISERPGQYRPDDHAMPELVRDHPRTNALILARDHTRRRGLRQGRAGTARVATPIDPIGAHAASSPIKRAQASDAGTARDLDGIEIAAAYRAHRRPDRVGGTTQQCAESGDQTPRARARANRAVMVMSRVMFHATRSQLMR